LGIGLKKILIGDDGSDFEVSKNIHIFMMHPGGHVDSFVKSNPDDFEYDDGVYMIDDPYVDEETGKRYLGYDVGTPVPWFSDKRTEEGEDDFSVKLMDEINSSATINKLAKVPNKGPGLLEKLKDVPPWVFVAVLVAIVLIGQWGSLF